MNRYQSLADQFKSANLVVKILDTPLRVGRGMDQIVQMDIERKTSGTRRHEIIRIYPGHESNLIQVRNVDKSTSQLVLMVKEPVREFEEEIRITKWNTEKMIVDGLKSRPRLKYFKRGNSIIVIQKTMESTRYFLMGVDERQLFIAQLTGPATTVTEARRLLGKTVEFANRDRRRGSALDRQGEWFFLEVDKETREYIDSEIKKGHVAPRTKMNIGEYMGRRNGNPHIADEIVFMGRGRNGETSVRPPLMRSRVFVRGNVRHVDHKTVRFDNWREVIKNNEGATSDATASGVFWID